MLRRLLVSLKAQILKEHRIKSYVVLFAFLEDVVLSHAHRLHDHLDSLQVDVAVLRQVALQTNTDGFKEKNNTRQETLNDTHLW